MSQVANTQSNSSNSVENQIPASISESEASHTPNENKDTDNNNDKAERDQEIISTNSPSQDPPSSTGSCPSPKESETQLESEENTVAPASAVNGGREISNKILYVGNLAKSASEEQINEIFSSVSNPIKSIKLLNDKNKLGFNYAFIEFNESEDAEKALNSLNGKDVNGSDIKVNWAYQSAAIAGGSTPEEPSYNIFVGDLSSEVNDEALKKAFTKFGSLKQAHVMWDMQTSRSRGYGFVTFGKQEDAENALQSMNGEWLGGRAIRCNWASHKSHINNSNTNNNNNSNNNINNTNGNAIYGHTQQFAYGDNPFKASNQQQQQQHQQQGFNRFLNNNRTNRSNYNNNNSNNNNNNNNGNNKRHYNNANNNIHTPQFPPQFMGGQITQVNGQALPQQSPNLNGLMLHNFGSNPNLVPFNQNNTFNANNGQGPVPVSNMNQQTQQDSTHTNNHNNNNNNNNNNSNSNSNNTNTNSINNNAGNVAMVSPQTYDIVLRQTPSWQTTVYIGNIAHFTQLHEMIPLLQSFGFIVDFKFHPERGCAFVKYDSHERAALAIIQLAGFNLNGRPLKCGWGKERPQQYQSRVGGHVAGEVEHPSYGQN